MLFNSWSFLLFFPLVLGTYWALPHRWRWAWLLAASCVFYMAFVPAYVLILFAVIGIDYAAGRLIARSEGATRRRWLLLSVAANLAMLGFFKYFNFFADNARALADLIGWNLPLPVLQILLPIGLSFHVFQSLSYTIEVYRGHQAPERHLGIYALYVMFWPQLVAGPIERPQNLLPQFHAEQRFEASRTSAGLRLMLWGFFKKVVIADRLALLVNPVFAQPAEYGGLTLVLAAVLFAFQIYCDFSGYSDIARGAARTLGIELMLNFNRPYFACNISDFWRRWHISLSTWFNDYVYMPLAFALKERGRAGVALAAVTTFFLSGLWHGANWTFIVWGLLHGAAISWEAVTRKRRRAWAARVPKPLWSAGSWAVTFGFVCLGYIFFRSASLADAGTFLARIPDGLASQLQSYQGFRGAFLALDPQLVQLPLACVGIAALLAGDAWQARADVSAFIARRPRWVRWCAYGALLLVIGFFGVFEEVAFIYFQF